MGVVHTARFIDCSKFRSANNYNRVDRQNRFGFQAHSEHLLKKIFPALYHRFSTGNKKISSQLEMSEMRGENLSTFSVTKFILRRIIKRGQ